LGSSVFVNGMGTVHKDSGGKVICFPDVCKTPSPGGPPIPIPYPNIGMSSDTAQGTKKVKNQGNPTMVEGSNYSTSTGDEAGTLKGLVSSTTKGKCEYISFSSNVKFEGKGVCRMGDLMKQNSGNAL
jgi:hypothetical protein